tara:strand:+ start:83 stop:484 length:402 start_codon:yes stop_codon:yes gene_type:complete
MIDYEKEKRAYDMLKFVAYSFPAEFDWELAALGVYSKAQKERSDKAIEEFEKEHPYESSPQLKAFRELERLGVYTQNDFFSPIKAANEFYTKRLDKYERNRGRNSQGRSVPTVTNRRLRPQSRIGRTRPKPTD